MAITYVGDFGIAEGTTGNTLTFDKDNPSVTDIATNDVVMAQVQFRDTAGTIGVTTTGGQTWTEVHDAVDTLVNGLYTCVFNGTWTADPVWSRQGTTTNVARAIWVWVLRGVDTGTIFDVTLTWATDTDTSYNIADFNTNTNGAWAICLAGSVDDNTWTVNNSFTEPAGGAGNVYVSTGAGADTSLVACRKEIATAGAVGATTMTQATNGPDNGYKVFGAIKPAAGAAATSLLVPTNTSSLIVR
jgi:hypothetical protein